MEKLNNYIGMKRRTIRLRLEPSSTQEIRQSIAAGHCYWTHHAVVFPSLNGAAIAKLEILYNDMPSPSPDVVKIWAGKLNASINDVTTWIDLCRATRPQVSNAVGEPSGQLIGKIQRDVGLSAEERPLGASHLPTPESSTSPEPSPLAKLNFYPERTPPPPSPEDQSKYMYGAFN